MALYLRDEILSNLTFDPDAIKNMVKVFENRFKSMPEVLAHNEQDGLPAFLSFTIRFDKKGNRIFKKESLFHHYKQAVDVERINFSLSSGRALRSNQLTGSYLELHLDKLDKVSCYLRVSSDDEQWVNGSFTEVKEELVKNKNRNALIRNSVVDFIIQVLGLLIGFIISLWGASKVAPNLLIENAFLISFLLILLIFFNFWSKTQNILRHVLQKTFPPIRFYRPGKNKWFWLPQGIVVGIVVAATLYSLGLMFNYIGIILGAFINK